MRKYAYLSGKKILEKLSFEMQQKLHRKFFAQWSLENSKVLAMIED